MCPFTSHKEQETKLVSDSLVGMNLCITFNAEIAKKYVDIQKGLFSVKQQITNPIHKMENEFFKFQITVELLVRNKLNN